MTLEEEIQHCKEVAKENRKTALEYERAYAWDTAHGCRECAKEHEQLALWLTELKSRRIAAIKELERVKLPKTNADRIRQMSDEELAEEIAVMCLNVMNSPVAYMGIATFDVIKNANEKWLKSEVQEDVGTD